MATLQVDDVVPFDDWPTAARAALAFLHRTVGMDVWLVTQLQLPRQVVLHSHPEEVLPPGSSILWDRSFCHSMVSGVGPRVATVIAATPAYRGLETELPQRVAAYLGVPLVSRDGALFGTLCGLSVRAQPRTLTRFLPTVEMTARMLSSMLPVGTPVPTVPTQREGSSSTESVGPRPT